MYNKSTKALKKHLLFHKLQTKTKTVLQKQSQTLTFSQYSNLDKIQYKSTQKHLLLHELHT